jgi:hypothetical protein
VNSSEKCPICGKRGKRPCPATGGLICPACCGSRRGSKLNCPSECRFFPFGSAGEQLWNEVDRSWFGKAMQYADARLGERTMAEIFSRHLPEGERTEEGVVFASFPTLYEALFVPRDGEAITLVQQWEAEGWAGLNNDEKVLMRYRRDSSVTVIEVQRSLDERSLECVDLFEPGSKPFCVIVTESSLDIPRFTRLLVWVTHFPNFSRVGPIATEVPELIWPIWLDLAQKQALEQEKSRPGLTLKQFLSENIADSTRLISVLLEESKKRMLASLDLHHCLTEFRLLAPMSEVKAILDSKPDFAAAEALVQKGSN